MGGVGSYNIGGGLQAPADSLGWTVEVTPEVLVIRATSHPRHWVRLWTRGGRTLRIFSAGHLTGRR